MQATHSIQIVYPGQAGSPVEIPCIRLRRRHSDRGGISPEQTIDFVEPIVRIILWIMVIIASSYLLLALSHYGFCSAGEDALYNFVGWLHLKFFGAW